MTNRYALALALLFPVSALAVSLSSVSDFEDGTTQGWAGGATPTNITTGGPAGAGDNFLQIGNGGSLSTFNTGADWSGDFTTAGVIGISVDLMVPGGDIAKEIRIVLFGIGGGTTERWTTTNEVVVPTDGVWRNVVFSLLESDLSQVQGSDTYANLMAGVSRVMLRHDLDPASGGGGEAVTGVMGIDNVNAEAFSPVELIIFEVE